MTGGVYRIECLANGRFYIGKSKDLSRRKSSHLSQLRRGVHPNRILQSSFDKHGINSITFRTLVVCETEYQTWLEGKLLNLYAKEPLCANLTIDSLAPMMGKHHTKEARVKIGEASKGNTHCLGKPRAQDVRERIAANSASAKDFEFLSPDGVLHSGKSVKAFAEKNGLCVSSMAKLLRGKLLTYRGWTCPATYRERKVCRDNPKLANPYAFMSPGGEVFTGMNVQRFCKEHGLSQPSMNKVNNGTRRSHTGWTRCSGEI